MTATGLVKLFGGAVWNVRKVETMETPVAANDNERLLSLEETAKRLGVCKRTLDRHILHGYFPYIVMGSGRQRVRRKIHPKDLENFIETRRRFDCQLDKPAKSPFDEYHFQISQVRFTGSTGRSSKRDAETFEKQRAKIEARIEVAALTAQESAPLNFATAAARYYLQVGQHLRGDGPSNCQWSLNWLEHEIGSTTRLATIDDALVAKLVGIRRGESKLNRRPSTAVQQSR